MERPGPGRRRLGSGLRFRTRIALLVLTAIFALGTTTVVAVVLGRHSERQISSVETRYLPLLELNRDLKALFAGIAERSRRRPRRPRRRPARRRSPGATPWPAAGRRPPRIADNGGDADALLAAFRRYYELAPRRWRSGSRPSTIARRACGARERGHAGRAAPSARPAWTTATTPDRARLAEAFDSARASPSARGPGRPRGRGRLRADDACCPGGSCAAPADSLRRGLERRRAPGPRPLQPGDPRPARATSSATWPARPTGPRRHLRAYRERADEEEWVKTGVAGLAGEIAGELDAAELGRRALAYLAPDLGARSAVAYAADADGALTLARHRGRRSGCPPRSASPPGEGVIGQATRDGELRLSRTSRTATARCARRSAGAAPASSWSCRSPTGPLPGRARARLPRRARAAARSSCCGRTREARSPSRCGWPSRASA